MCHPHQDFGEVCLYLQNPPRDQLTKLYRGMDVFVCCSKFEGFYNPGAEASIQGCVLLGNNVKSNGCSDYLNSYTGYKYENVETVKQLIEKLTIEEMTNKVSNCQQLIREKIGSRKTNMKRFVRILEGK